MVVEFCFVFESKCYMQVIFLNLCFQGGNVGHLHKLLGIESSSQVCLDVGWGFFPFLISNRFNIHYLETIILGDIFPHY